MKHPNTKSNLKAKDETKNLLCLLHANPLQVIS